MAERGRLPKLAQGLLAGGGALTGCTTSSRHRGVLPAVGRGLFQPGNKGGDRSALGGGRACSSQRRGGLFAAGAQRREWWGMVLTKVVSLCFLTSAAVIFFNVLTGKHQQLADEVSSVLHQSFTRSTFEVNDPAVLEVRHEVRPAPPARALCAAVVYVLLSALPAADML